MYNASRATFDLCLENERRARVQAAECVELGNKDEFERVAALWAAIAEHMVHTRSRLSELIDGYDPIH